LNICCVDWYKNPTFFWSKIKPFLIKDIDIGCAAAHPLPPPLSSNSTMESNSCVLLIQGKQIFVRYHRHYEPLKIILME